jgi:hypothetical protein
VVGALRAWVGEDPQRAWVQGPAESTQAAGFEVLERRSHFEAGSTAEERARGSPGRDAAERAWQGDRRPRSARRAERSGEPPPDAISESEPVPEGDPRALSGPPRIPRLAALAREDKGRGSLRSLRSG